MASHEHPATFLRPPLPLASPDSIQPIGPTRGALFVSKQSTFLALYRFRALCRTNLLLDEKFYVSLEADWCSIFCKLQQTH
jgi:hypothetical protein